VTGVELATAAGLGREQARQHVGAATAAALQLGRGLDLTEANLAGCDLSGCDLRGAVFNRAILHGTRFDGANLEGATLICPGAERTSFRNANLRGVYIHALAAQVCNFDGANLDDTLDATGSLFHGCSFLNTSLRGARLSGAAFYQCDLTKASFARAALQGATINECVLDEAEFFCADVSQLTITKCHLSDTSFVNASGMGLVIQRPTAADGLAFDGASLPALRLLNVAGPDVSARGAQLENGQIVECQLRGAELQHLAGRALCIRDSDLTGADLGGAYLYRAFISGDPPTAMSLVSANLTGANLVQAYVAADLTEAVLRRVNAAYARLNQSVLRGADLSGAALYEASMVKTDCTDAKLGGVAPPFFADRCAGLMEALLAVGAADAMEAVRRLKAVTSIGKGGST